MSELNVGQPAPGFEAQSTAGTLQLKEKQGRKVVLYFYPRDNTPGCTTEASDFKDLIEEFKKTDCVVLGVSRDTMASHERFSKKLELPFPLIADPQEDLCNLFDVMREKTMYGRRVRTIERSTFLIDRQGQIAKVWRGVKVPGHAAEVLDAAQALE